jgi:transketolase
MKLENDKTLVRSTRAAYADALLQLGAETDDVVVLDADLSESTMTCKFAEKYPDKFYNMGIAEQSMMGTAAGLATCGLTPICSTFSVFACLRSGEQVRTSIAYPKLNVKIVTTHSGLSIGTAGATHFCEEDLAIMRAIPNMTVIAPSDYLETVKAVKAAVAYPGPVYIRLGRGDAPVLYSELEDYQIGKAITYKDGSDITLIATGVMMQRAIAAADLLEAKGVSCRIIDMHTIKPFDHEIVEKAAKETKAIITLEEHNINGGLGSAVAETVAAVKGEKAVVKILGIPDVFGGVASAELLWDSYHMDADSVCNIALDLL